MYTSIYVYLNAAAVALVIAPLAVPLVLYGDY